MKYNLLELYEKTLKGPWVTVGNDTQYKLIGDEHILCLCFQGSVSDIDCKYNFKFWIKPYKNLLPTWKLAKGKIAEDVMANLGNRKLLIMGYSHGGSLSILAHEYFWYNNNNPLTFAFAPARVIWLPFNNIKKRFKELFVIKTRGDIVTHVPPNLFGYFHVGIKKVYGKFSFISHKPHFPDRYREALKDQYIEV